MFRFFQNPHVIYATTRVNSFTIFLLSLFYCIQNLCQLNRQFFRRTSWWSRYVPFFVWCLMEFRYDQCVDMFSFLFLKFQVWNCYFYTDKKEMFFVFNVILTTILTKSVFPLGNENWELRVETRHMLFSSKKPFI